MNATLALIGTLGAQEVILIFLVLLLLFGAKKLPELARGIGKSMGEFKKAREEFEHEITRAEIETKKTKPAPGNEAAKEKEADSDKA
ncbi:MAG: twin-arginine translocase TatA/TatE family subunit [Luteolibacter sp.]|jgi:sec-independent protein translocase protein TatA